MHSTETKLGMLSIARKLVFLVTILATLLTTTSLRAQADAFSAADILPPATLTAVTIHDLAKTQQRWKESQFGRLQKDDSMQPFVAETLKRFNGPEAIKAFGFTWKQLQEIRRGAITYAAVELDDRKASILLVETTEELATNLVESITSERAKMNVTSQPTEFGDSTFIVFEHKRTGDAVSYSTYGFHSGFLIFTDDEELSKTVVDNFSKGTETQRLRDLESHQRIDAQFDDLRLEGAPDHDITFYVRDTQIPIINGVGGRVTFATKENDLRAEAFADLKLTLDGEDRVYATKVLPTSPLPTWTGMVESYLAANWNHYEALLGYGTWFDKKYGEGEEGVFEEVLGDLYADPDSPGVNIRDDLLAFLKTPTLALSTASGVSYAVQVTDESRVRKALRGLLEGDPDVEPVKFNENVAGWRFKELGEEESESSLGPNLSHFTFFVANEHLVVATNEMTSREVFEALQAPSESDRFKQLDASEAIAHGQARTFIAPSDWSSLRSSSSHRGANRDADKTEQVSLLPMKTIIRELDLVDMKLLPEFDSIKQHLGPASLLVTPRSQGWWISAEIQGAVK